MIYSILCIRYLYLNASQVSQIYKINLWIFLPKPVFPPHFLLVSTTTIHPVVQASLLLPYPLLSTFITRSCHFYFRTAWFIFSTATAIIEIYKSTSYFIMASATVSSISLLPLLALLIQFPPSSQMCFVFKYKSHHVTVFEMQTPCHGQEDLLDLALSTSQASSLRIPSSPFYSPTLLHSYRLSKHKVL